MVANLPYYITTPILTGLLEHTRLIQSITAMMQKEVAERIVAKAGEAAYGSLSVFVQSFADVQIAFSVPNTVFIPKPNVGSAVVHMERKEKDERFDPAFLLSYARRFLCAEKPWPMRCPQTTDMKKGP